MRGARAVPVLLAFAPTPTEAHAFAQRYDLPLPLWYYLAGAGAAVALSFLVAMRTGPPSRLSASRVLVCVPQAAWDRLRTLSQTLALSCFVLLLAAGFAGEQGDWDSNLLPVFVWVIWWVGLTLLCAIVGPVWRWLDPWRAAADAVARWLPGSPRRSFDLPRWLDCWPAVLLMLAFAWAELVWTENAVPRRLAGLALAWSATAWAGMALVGRRTWRERFDPFDRFFDLVGRFAPLAASRKGPDRVCIALRWPGAGLCAGPLPSPAGGAFVVVVLSMVAFDGISETPAWEAVVGAAMAGLYAAGVVQVMGYGFAGALVKTAGLAAVPLAAAVALMATAAVTSRIAGEPTLQVARRFVLTFVPIAVAYHLAHYLSYLLVQGQAALPLVSDPLGLGWDLFATRGREIDIAVIEVRTVWLAAVAAIVAGHVLAILLAHAEARLAYGPRAARSQVPLAVLMVAYTMLSLWILSQPIVSV